jgi:hypothetical protein
MPRSWTVYYGWEIMRMATATINIPLDPETAQIYSDASEEQTYQKHPRRLGV